MLFLKYEFLEKSEFLPPCVLVAKILKNAQWVKNDLKLSQNLRLFFNGKHSKLDFWNFFLEFCAPNEFDGMTIRIV